MAVDLTSLNDEQRDAVTHGDGPLLVVAAAGSGKTRVLTHRVAWLIDQGERPSSILLATFTRKAAKEMIERATALVGDVAADVHAGTLHSLFLRILRAEQYPWPSFDVVDDRKAKRMIRDLMRETGRGDSDIAQVMSQISLWKNDLVTPDAALEDDPNTAAVYAAYERAKNWERLLDFDDMLVRAVELFRREPDVLDRYRRRTPWVLVDEAQDTSTAQWAVLEMLAGTAGGDPDSRAGVGRPPIPADHNVPGAGAEVNGKGPPRHEEPLARPGNITVVADWRQAIYSWRGARPEYILDFERRFPGARTIQLPRNYRSTRQVVDAANSLIRHTGRDLEDMVPNRGDGPDPVVTIAESSEEEAAVVVGEIEARLNEGARPRDFAVLYRVNSYSRAFEDALTKARIPYVVIGSAGFFGRMEVSDVVAYLRFVHDPNDEDALRRIVNRPTRFLGRAYCDAVVDYARESGRTIRNALEPPTLGRRQSTNAADFAWHVDVLVNLADSGRSIRELIQTVRDTIGYDRWLVREEGSGSADEDRLENLAELESVAATWGADLPGFLGYVARQQAQSRSDEVGDKVQLLTIHRSKGLEWPTVFVVGVSEGVLPHRRSTDLEEERRLAYVAETRAQDELHMSAVVWWQNRQLAPSRFLGESGFPLPIRDDELEEVVA